MKTRPKLRQTRRTLGAAHRYLDAVRSRFVVYRTAGGITRKTSVRYGWTLSPRAAKRAAEKIAGRLHCWPAAKLAQFQFSR